MWKRLIAACVVMTLLLTIIGTFPASAERLETAPPDSSETAKVTEAEVVETEEAEETEETEETTEDVEATEETKLNGEEILNNYSTMPILEAPEPRTTPLPSSSKSGTCGDNLTWELDYYTETLTISGTGDMWDDYPDAPDSSNDPWLPWYDYKSNIKNVIINSGVTSIGNDAFRNCSSLTSVSIPNSVTSIGDDAFYDCDNLSDVYYSGTEEQWNAITIGSNNECLINATIHYNTIAGGECGDNLTWTLDDMGTLTISGTGDMWDWNWYDDKAPWYDNRSSIKNVVINDSVTSIGNYAFYFHTDLTSITIPGSVTSIGSSAFYWCNGLTSITIPSSITSIGENAFANCTGLTRITILSGVKNIDSSAFYYCTNLSDVYYSGTEEQWNVITISSNNECLTNATIHYPIASGECGDNLTWTLDDESTLTISGTGDMWDWDSSNIPWRSYRNKIEYVVINNSVTSIGNYAFYNSSNLKSVIIPSSVINIGDYAFRNCTGLTSISIPNGVKNIGNSAFYGCAGLTIISIPSSVESIGEDSFKNCTGLISITIPDSIKSIENGVFYGCSNLKSIIIPSSVTSIDGVALA